MITVDSLVKRYGTTTAVDGMTFTVQPGRVTGFLGPNGAGKSTTMRVVLGLDRPTSGQALVDGRPFRDATAPLALVGSLLDGKAFDRSRSARNHLRAVGAANGVGRSRVEEVLEVAGLTSVAHRSAGSFSLGMGQRLGIATALLADPPVVMLDEPVNGLDPDGITWIRRLTRQLADEGRTVFLSSHLMSEMELTADHLVIVGRGRVLADTPMTDFISSTSGERVQVATPDATTLAALLAAPGVTVTSAEPGALDVRGVPASAIGEVAARHGIVLHQLATQRLSLEDAFMKLTNDTADFHGTDSRSVR
ncbi:MAG: ATP-binding cassette domain-containing protein [Candidatus Phosphoribacter sp.]